MQIPIIMGVQGEAQEIIEKYGAGLCFEPENEADFVAKLDQLLSDDKLYSECMKGGIRLAEDFDRNTLAAKMLEYIEASTI